MHDLLDREPMRTKLRERWGDEIVSDDGIADRNAVGSRVFNDPDELTWLESQVHPLVHSELRSWFYGLPADTEFAVAEIPLLFEGEMSDRFDLTIAIVAEESTRRGPARSRGQVGIEGREVRQLSQADKSARADHVVSNDGTPQELQEHLAKLLAGLSR